MKAEFYFMDLLKRKPGGDLMNNNTSVLIIALTIWNLATFFLMGADKRKARSNHHRISEKTLILSAFLFGGIGVLCGMYIFRHKTKHWKFRILVPVAVMMNIIAIYCLIQKLI